VTYFVISGAGAFRCVHPVPLGRDTSGDVDRPAVRPYPAS